MKLLEKVLQLIMPQPCVRCGDLLNLEEGMCAKCCIEMENDSYGCEFTLKFGSFNEDFTCKVSGRYTGALRHNIHRFKFSRKTGYAKGFGVMMERALEDVQKKFDIVCFVPMAERKQNRKGYNHAQLLAVELATRKGLQAFPLLKKIEETKSQHELSRSARRENLKGKFLASDESAGKRILLVDDVLTTGSTLCECAMELYRKDAIEVYGVCLAGTMYEKDLKGEANAK